MICDRNISDWSALSWLLSTLVTSLRPSVRINDSRAFQHPLGHWRPPSQLLSSWLLSNLLFAPCPPTHSLHSSIPDALLAIGVALGYSALSATRRYLDYPTPSVFQVARSLPATSYLPFYIRCSLEQESIEQPRGHRAIINSPSDQQGAKHPRRVG